MTATHQLMLQTVVDEIANGVGDDAEHWKARMVQIVFNNNTEALWNSLQAKINTGSYVYSKAHAYGQALAAFADANYWHDVSMAAFNLVSCLETLGIRTPMCAWAAEQRDAAIAIANGAQQRAVEAMRSCIECIVDATASDTQKADNVNWRQQASRRVADDWLRRLPQTIPVTELLFSQALAYTTMFGGP